jgi:hypothetical protein
MYAVYHLDNVRLENYFKIFEMITYLYIYSDSIYFAHFTSKSYKYKNKCIQIL